MYHDRPAPAPDRMSNDAAVGQLPSGDLAVAVGDVLVGRVQEDSRGYAAVRPGGAVVAVCADPDEAAAVLLEHAC